MPRVDLIIAFENGDLEGNEVLDLFADLVRTGIAWQLQGFYGRTALDLIESGYLSEDGRVLRDA